MDESAAMVLARLADGGMRDGLSLLDQCASATTGALTADTVYACLGIAGSQKCAELMGYIAAHNSKEALGLFNRLYAEGKDLSAMLDELACLARDLLVLRTAPDVGITMLSGVATEQEAKALLKAISPGELVRMIGLLQQTMSSFTRSASRRVDAELCILNLCQPELSLDAESLNARLTRLEEQIKTGSFVAAKPAAVVPEDMDDGERPPMPSDEDAPPPDAGEAESQTNPEPEQQTPMAFWTDLMASVRKELKPPASGFFVHAPNAPIKGALKGNKLELRCMNQFVSEAVNRPAILEVVSRKASAQLGRQILVSVVDMSAKQTNNPYMEQLLNFGRNHSEVVKIKE